MYQWNAADYANHSIGQERWARELLTNVELRAEEQVLDVGCGDGRITADMATRLPQGRVVGVDLSADMIAHATTQFADVPNLSFRQMNAGHLQFADEFTLVFSSAALHWVKEHRPVLVGIGRALKVGGRFVAQMGGAGNGAGIIAAFDSVRTSMKWREYFIGFVSSYGFHHAHDYVHWLQDAGLQVEQCQLFVKDMLHADKSAFTGWIRTAWHPYASRVPAELREHFIAEVVRQYVQAHPVDAVARVHVQMVRLQVRAHKAVASV